MPEQNPALATITTKELIAEVRARTGAMLITYLDNESIIQTSWGGRFIEVLGLFTLLRRNFVAMLEDANTRAETTPSDGDTPDDPTGEDTE